MTAPGVDTDEQAALRSTLRDLVARKADSAAVRAAAAAEHGFDADLWSTLVEQVGAAALCLPEAYDGAGATWTETHIAAEELGRGLVPSPFLGSAVLAAQAVLASGDAAARERLLPRIAAGEVVSLCWAGEQGWAAPGIRTGGGGAGGGSAGGGSASGDGSGTDTSVSTATLTGTATAVLDGHAAGTLLVVTDRGDGRVGLAEVAADAPGVTVTRVPSMDPTRPLATVTCDSATGTEIPVRESFLPRLRAAGWAAVSAEQVGAMTRALEETVAYTSQRRQFGRAIGSFQALKHRMADMYVLAQTARSISYSAAARVAEMLEQPDVNPGQNPGDAHSGDMHTDDAHSDDASAAARVTEAAVVEAAVTEAATAKAYCSEAFASVAGEMIQLHGGIGITWEHDAQLFFKRAHGTSQLLGQPHELFATLEPAAGVS